jgi:hypothetical protein
MIDADDFKAFNDTRGHLAGNMALRRLASVLRKTVRGHEGVCFSSLSKGIFLGSEGAAARCSPRGIFVGERWDRGRDAGVAGAPRTDPSVRRYRTRLLPWV